MNVMDRIADVQVAFRRAAHDPAGVQNWFGMRLLVRRRVAGNDDIEEPAQAHAFEQGFGEDGGLVGDDGHGQAGGFPGLQAFEHARVDGRELAVDLGVVALEGCDGLDRKSVV